MNVNSRVLLALVSILKHDIIYLSCKYTGKFDFHIFIVFKQILLLISSGKLFHPSHVDQQTLLYSA